MISLKDWALIAGIVVPVVSGGFYAGSLDQRITESSQQIRRHVAEQQEVDLLQKKWKLEDRLKVEPDNKELQRELEMTNRLLEKNRVIQLELGKERM